MSTSPNALVANDPRQSFFSRLGAGVQNAMPYVQQIGRALLMAGGSPQQLSELNAQDELGLQRQRLGSELQDQDLRRQLLTKQLSDYMSPQAKADFDLANQAKSLAQQREFAPPQDIVGSVAGGGRGYFQQKFNPTTGQYDISPVMIESQVPNPALKDYSDAAAGHPPNLVMDWNTPPNLPPTVTSRSQLMAAPPLENIDQQIATASLAALNAGRDPMTDPAVTQLLGVKRQAMTPKSPTDQIQQQLNDELSKPQPDQSKVKNLQDRLRAINPLGEDRLRDAEDRAALANARAEQAKQEFLPAIATQVVQGMSTQASTRRLLQILEPYKNDNTPFGSFVQTVEYRLGKAQSDQIGQELAAINLTSLQQAGSVLKSMGGVRAAQVLDKVLQHTPDPLHDSVANMYQKLTNIDRATATFLQAADKYGRKSSADIPPASMQPYTVPTGAPPMTTTPSGPPPPPPKTAADYLRSIQQ